jgi:hypothetical protein
VDVLHVSRGQGCDGAPVLRDEDPSARRRLVDERGQVPLQLIDRYCFHGETVPQSDLNFYRARLGSAPVGSQVAVVPAGWQRGQKEVERAAGPPRPALRLRREDVWRPRGRPRRRAHVGGLRERFRPRRPLGPAARGRRQPTRTGRLSPGDMRRKAPFSRPLRPRRAAVPCAGMVAPGIALGYPDATL